MGPRIYPSQQDTNLTAKGSLLLNEDSEIAIVDVYVNNNLVAKEYSNVDGLYVVSLNIGDVVRVEAGGTFNVIPKRFDYTTDYENGDNGIKVTDFPIQSGISSYSFTATTLANGYNFEYYLDTSPFFINLIYEYSGVTSPDNLYTVSSLNQRVTIDNQQFSIPNYTYSADTGFSYNIGQVFITGGTSQSFDTTTTFDPISGGDCVRWQFGVLNLKQDAIDLGTIGTSPVTPVVCNSTRVFNLGLGPYNLVQNATYTVNRRDTSNNISPTVTPTPTPGPTPTPTPTPDPTEGQYMLAVRDNNLVYRTSNYGSSWSQVTGFTTGMTITSSAISKTGQYQVISVYNGNIFMSNNYGVSFTGMTVSDRYISVAISSTGQYVSAITDNTSASRKIRYSTNYGATFTFKSSIGQESTDVAVDDAGLSYLSYRNGIQKFDPSTLILSSVYSATTLGFGVQWDGVAVSGDGSKLATVRDSTVAYRLENLGVFYTGNCLNADVSIVRNSRNGVYLKTYANAPAFIYNSYSTNSGVSWSVDEFGFPALSHTGIYQAYALGDDIRLSTNYGSTYSTIYSLAGANWKNMSMNQ